MPSSDLINRFFKKKDEGVTENVEEHLSTEVSSTEERAGGVDEIEAITSTWSTAGLAISWISILLASVAISLDNQTMTVFANYATSDFKQQSLLSTVQVVNGVLNVVTRPPLAKIADVIGRFEAFLVSVISITIGFIMLAKSPNIETYFAAQIFYTIGQIGIQFMQGVFAADTTDMVHRAIFMSLPLVWYVFLPWCGGPLTTTMLKHSTWRWGIGMFAIIVPVCSIPMLTILFINKMKSKRLRAHKKEQAAKIHWRKFLLELDIGGSILLAAGLALVFVAIPLASTDDSEWKKTHIIVMIVIGGLCLIGFPIYEYFVPSYPIMSFKLFKNFDITKSFIFIMFYYLAFYMYSTYFLSWLMVVFNLSNTAATNVNVTSTVASTASGMISAIIIKYVKSIKWFIVAGISVAMIGIGLIYHFREPGSSVGQLVAAQLIDGIGTGLIATPNSVLVQSYCSHDIVAQTLALYNSFLALGQVIGDAVSGSVYRRQYPKYLRKYAPGLNETEIFTVINDMTTATMYPMGSDTRKGIIKSYNSVMRTLLIPPIVFFALMLLLAITFRDRKLDTIFNTRGKVIGKSKGDYRASDETYRNDDEFSPEGTTSGNNNNDDLADSPPEKSAVTQDTTNQKTT